eukprot:140014_1
MTKGNNSRTSWQIGSYCCIYSRSKNKWFDGQIKAIVGEKDKEWLHVKYGELNHFNRSKKMQRNCSDIKPIANNHPLLIKKHSKCKIYSKDINEWYIAEVIQIFVDDEGEWLKVKYSASDNKVHIVEIQRFSKDIKLIDESNSNIPIIKHNMNSKHIRRKSDSSYYLYASTDSKEAEKYKPQKVDKLVAANIENNTSIKNKGSTWNTGATMEQFDYSEWMKKRVTELLLGVTFKESEIKINKVTNIEGSATILLVRGKYRPGYDINIECKWKGYLNDGHKTKCNGTLKMMDMSPDDECDEWEYEVNIKKNNKGNKQGLLIVNNDRKSIIDAINVFVKELYSKKS